jgi:hypothetical protein
MKKSGHLQQTFAPVRQSAAGFRFGGLANQEGESNAALDGNGSHQPTLFVQSNIMCVKSFLNNK